MAKFAKRTARVLSYLLAVAKNAYSSFVCAMAALNMTASIPAVFRTYRAPENQRFNCTIWEAARATTAGPTFFEQIKIGGPGTTEPYVDGGLGRNNPISVVLEEAELMFPNHEIACIISIGSGKPSTIGIPKPGWFQRVIPTDVINAMVGMATDCERSHQETAKRFADTPNVYFRFNVEQGMQKVGLADWAKVEEVTANTNIYLSQQEENENVNTVVRVLRERLATDIPDLR